MFHPTKIQCFQKLQLIVFQQNQKKIFIESSQIGLKLICQQKMQFIIFHLKIFRILSKIRIFI